MMNGEKHRPARVSPEQARLFLKEVLMPVPRSWICIVTAAAVLSLFKVTYSAEGQYAVTFEITGLTLALLALVWLPSVVRVIGLTGVTLKVAGSEAQFAGVTDLLALFPPEAAQNILPALIAGSEGAEVKATPERRAQLRRIRKELEDRLTDVTEPKDLAELAEIYEKARADLPRGPERTFHLRRVMAEVRAALRKAKPPRRKITDFAELGDGKRAIALAAVQVNPDPASFPVVLDAIRRPRSGFEQYEALQAATALLPVLEGDQLRQLKRTIEEVRDQHPQAAGSERWALSGKLLEAIERELKMQ